MRTILAGAMAVAMALCVSAGVIWFGAVDIDVASPVFGFAILMGVMWAAKLFFNRVVSWKPSPMHWPVVAFVAYATARYFTSPIEYSSRIELFQVWLLAFVYFLSACNFYRSRDRAIIFGTLLVLGLGEAIYGFWQFGTKADAVLYWTRSVSYRGRASGTYFCPNNLAGFLEMVVCMAVARVAVQRFSKKSVQKSALQKVFILYVTLFLIAGFLLTKSRSGWVALIVALGTLWFWGDWDVRALWPRLAVGLGIIGIVAVIGYSVTPIRLYVIDTLSGDEKKQGTALRDPSLGGRTLMWQGTLHMIKDHPLVGTGPGTWQWFFPKYRAAELQIHPEDAHNDILHATSDYGLIGAGLIIWAIVAFFRHASLIARGNTSSEQRAFAVGSGLAVTAILVHSWFDFNMHVFANALVLVSLMGCTVAIDDSGERYARAEMNRWAKYGLALAVLAVCGAGIWFVRPAASAFYDAERGDAFNNVLEWDAALAMYERAAKADPRFPEVYSKIGHVYALQARWRIGEEKAAERKDLTERAAGAFEKSLELNPYQASVLVRLAAIYETRGESERAEKCYARALELEPRSAAVYEQMGLFLRRAGQESRALAAFERSKELKATIVSIVNILELKGNR
jgi:O-antigen ligase